MGAQQALTAALGVTKGCFNLGCDQIQSSWSTPATLDKIYKQSMGTSLVHRPVCSDSSM